MRKLKWPLNRNKMSKQDGLILLAYDILWRLKFSPIDEKIDEDVQANMNGLLNYLEQNFGEDLFEEN